MRLRVLTISDGVAAGSREDRSGNAIVEWAKQHGHSLIEHAVVPDRTDAITRTLVSWADAGDCDVVLTTGGTGFTRKDVTPEASRAAIERDAPGLAEVLRAKGAASTPYAWLSRGVAGIRAQTLIVNLPGSENAVRDGLATLEPLLPHAVQLIRGESTHKHELPHG